MIAANPGINYGMNIPAGVKIHSSLYLKEKTTPVSQHGIMQRIELKK